MAYIQTANRTIERSPNVALIIEINRLVKRAFDVAGIESSSRCGDSSGDENILYRRTANRTIERWSNVAAIGADSRD